MSRLSKVEAKHVAHAIMRTAIAVRVAPGVEITDTSREGGEVRFTLSDGSEVRATFEEAPAPRGSS